MIELKNAIRSVQNNNIKPIYFLRGDDHFLQNFFIEKVCNSLFLEENINKCFLTPNEMSGKEIIDSLLFSDLFSTKKLFILRDPQQIKGKPAKDLLNYCSNPNPNHFLVLVNDNYMDKSTFTRSLTKIVDAINVSTPFANDLFKWARFFFKENDKNADSLVLEEIIENYGDCVFNIKNEIDKLCILIDDNEIKSDDLTISNAWGRSRQRWELFTTIGKRDLEKSIKLSKEIIGDTETMMSLIYPLTSFFQELLYVKMNNGTYSQSNSYIPLSKSIKNNIVLFSRGFTRSQIEKSIKTLETIERKQKTSTSNDESDFIHFLYDAIG
tara:strand:+ start:13867 stop:14841 length:975 start_codon:yes stop_codon:yes gene_type:complete